MSDIVKTSFDDLIEGQHLFELCGGLGGFGVLVQITTLNKDINHRDLINAAEKLLEQAQFYERIEEKKWNRVQGGEY